MEDQKNTGRPDNTRLQNYLALIAIAPAILSITAYEFVDFSIHYLYRGVTDYHPLDGLGILIPMALMMELFTYFFSKIIIKKVNVLTRAMASVADGDYNISLDANKMAPMTEIVESFNSMTSELASVETLRTDFINDFSHEFKTPIVSIHGFADLLLSEDLDDDERREYLTIISTESARLSNLAQQTMLMSKLDTQIQIAENAVKDFSLDEQIRRCVILLQKSWSEKNIDMNIDLDSVKYRSDPTLIEHIWINLLNNAIKFTPEGGTIRVNLKRLVNGGQMPDTIRFSVTDSGCGMTEEQTKHIFDKYYQADSSRSSKGLGLGLAISKRVIDLCGGGINVSSTPGKGTTFTIDLPTKEPHSK